MCYAAPLISVYTHQLLHINVRELYTCRAESLILIILCVIFQTNFPQLSYKPFQAINAVQTKQSCYEFKLLLNCVVNRGIYSAVVSRLQPVWPE